MALALLGKCVALLALVLLFYTCCYAFKIRDGTGVHPTPSSPSSSSIGVEHSQRTTCVGQKFGRCPERTTPSTASSPVTPSPRRWHEAMFASRSPPIGRKPPVETDDEEDARSLEIGSRPYGERFIDRSPLPGSTIKKKDKILRDEGSVDNGESDSEERKDLDDSDVDDDDNDVLVEDEEEVEDIQAEDDESGEKDEESKDDVEDEEEELEGKSEGSERSDSTERETTKEEAKTKDARDSEEEEGGSVNVLGWSFKLSAGGFSESKSVKDAKHGKGLVDEAKERRSELVKDKKEKKDVAKDEIKAKEKSSVSRKQRKETEEKGSAKYEEDEGDGKDESPPAARKLEKVRYADKEKVRSVERVDAKPFDKTKTETPKSIEKTKKKDTVEEAKNVEAVEKTRSEPREEKKTKKDGATKERKTEVEREKKVKKSGNVEETDVAESKAKKKVRTVEVEESTKAKVESPKPKTSPKSEDERKPLAKADAPKSTTKSKEQVEKSDKRKVKREVPQAARNETKSKTKKHRDATKSLAELNDEILRVPSFVPNFTAVEDTICQQHGTIFLRQLRGYKLWALQMLDSSAKIPSGLLRGNVNQYGDFDQCLGVAAHVKVTNKTIKIQGKYCLASIDLHATHPETKLPVSLMHARSIIKGNMRDPGYFIPKFTTANWALCIPAACTAKDAETTLADALNYYNSTSGIRFTVEVDPNMCYVKQKSSNYSKETIGVLYFYAAVVCLAIVATVRDYLVVSEGKGCNYSERIIMSFSLRRTVGSLLRESKPGTSDVTCIHGIRSLCTIALYIAHHIIQIGWTPYVNRIALTELANNPVSCIMRVASVYTDSFLLLSGTLTAYNMAKELTSRGEIRWFCRFIGRIIRLTPALLAMIFWYAFVMEHIGSGPRWNSIIVGNADLCKKNAWTNLLYIQNFFPFEEMCATHTHQLALDMQLSILAPILVFFLHCKPIIGIIVLFFLVQVSATLRYLATMNNYLSIVIFHGISLKHLYKTANLTYTMPLHRATPYVFGVGLGVLLHYTGKNVSIHKVFVILGWLIATTFGSWSLFSPWRSARRDYVYDAEETTRYTVIGPVSWSLAMCWTIFACFTGHGGIVNRFLSNYWFIVLSRISYAVYLAQFAVFFYNVGTTRYATEFTLYRAIDPLGTIVVIGISIVITLLLDFPMQEVKNVVMECTDGSFADAPSAKSTTDGEKKADTDTKESAKKIVNGSKIFEDDEARTTEYDWRRDEETIDGPRFRKSKEKNRSFVGCGDEADQREREIIDRDDRRSPYSADSEEEAMEYFRLRREEEARRNRRSVSRAKEIKRSVAVENEDDYVRRRKEELYSSQFRRSESNESRPITREAEDHRSWEFLKKERSASVGPEPRRFLAELEEYGSKISRRSVPRSIDSKRTFSSESEEEPPAQRRTKNERRYPSVEPKISDEEEWEEELRIRRRRFMEKLASEQSGSLEEEEDAASLRRRSSAEGRIALLKDPSGNENMDAWTVSVGSRIAQLGSSQEPSEPEDDTVYLQRREYREKAPPFRERVYNEEESSVREDEDVASFNFVLTRDSKRKSFHDLTKLSQDDSTDIVESGWSLVKEEDTETLPKSSLGLFKRESIVKSQASEEDPEYYLPERPKLVQQEEEHPFKKAWQMQKSRSEEDASAYLIKDKKLGQPGGREDGDATSSKPDASGDKSGTDSETFVMEDADSISIVQDRNSDNEENQRSSRSEIGSEVESTSVGRSANTDPDDSGPCSISEIDENSQFDWPTEEKQFDSYKARTRRESMESDWNWEEEETNVS